LEHEPRDKAYNVCRGEAYTLLQLAEMVSVAAGGAPEIIVRNTAMGAEYSADNTRMLDEMGGFPFRSMSDCVRELYRWYQEHATLIDAQQLTFDDSE
jgi:nucleoside-diphosphate-sugar epimerase